MKRRSQRIWFLSLSILFMATGLVLLLCVLEDNITFFYKPSELVSKHLSPEKQIRLGGLVKKGSFKHQADLIQFIVTDYEQEILVNFSGLLPDLFREGQGIVAEGFLQNNMEFKATRILAKHDENYMPPELTELNKNEGSS